MGVKGARAGVRTSAGKRTQSLARRRETFLAHFAANCNVGQAARAAGVPLSTLYLWRRDEPGFAAEWADAQAAGYQMLEARLVAHALAGSQGETLDGVAEIAVEPVNVELALKLIDLRQRGATKRMGRPPSRPVTREDLAAELVKRLDMIDRRRRMAAARLAKTGGAAPKVIEHDSKRGAA